MSLKGALRFLWTYLKPMGARLILLVSLMIAATGLRLLFPQLLRSLVDRTLAGAPLPALLLPAGLFLAGALLIQALRITATMLSERIAWGATNALRLDLARHVLGLDIAFHKEHTPGELIERIDGDVTTLAGFFSQFVAQVGTSLLLILGVLLFLFTEGWLPGLVGLGSFALNATAVLSVSSITVKAWSGIRASATEMMSFVEERIAGREEVKALGADGYVVRGLVAMSAKHWRLRRRARFLESTASGVTIGAWALSLFAMLLLAFYLYRAGSVTLGTAMMLFFYVDLLNEPIATIREQMDEMQRARAALGRLVRLKAVEPAITDGAGAALPDGPLSVTLDRVSFQYEEGRPVLRGLSFHLEPGRTLGILGRTGSGKSSLIRLLCRFYDPQEGCVRLGGVDIRQVPLDALRSRIGLITQEVGLFGGTLRENLALFNPAITDERIWAAVADLGLTEWFGRFEEGLDSRIGPAGGGLSAGEAQLLALVRLSLRDPGLIILDEFTARIDPVTEALLQTAVDRLLAGRTAIIIAHRLTTVERADYILVLEQGSVVEWGPRSLLARDPHSHYSQLRFVGREEVLA
ncbi:ABC-type multidrug transport system fused ATPase/permease subunit [Symbiobacterium terraclitae]|uniref:ABC-type multidrug transport system fused ATPase/permease subunit n=1 Tax=Symbiobacterium terraclitae TaxID=557451 RepID=A0ABS4JPE1_9FIRM|nr:ABC transporter ATP-binding protein [Symbiobacterium terraclitae]MBP2017411.1 ABC-type multidrug transport system fused ATPase/permease subunit [Symbiobacterium terraclitae]